LAFESVNGINLTKWWWQLVPSVWSSYNEKRSPSDDVVCVTATEPEMRQF